MVCVEATLTAKGQITIPKVVRENLQISQGSKVLFVDTAEGFVLKSKSKNPINDLIVLREKSRKISEKELDEMIRDGKKAWSKF